MADTKTPQKSVFEILNAINCNEHVERKGKSNLSYLSWAWAWQIAKSNFPDATYRIYENPEGWNYFTDGRTCWVKTGVTIRGIEHIEYLPVMDYNNASIPVAKVTSFDVNKAIQRSLTKAIARHGLGLYIYAGEDLPDAADDVTREKVNEAIEEERFADFDQDLEVALAELKDAKSRKEVLEIDVRYRGVYGTYAKNPNQRYIDALAAACKRYPRQTKTK